MAKSNKVKTKGSTKNEASLFYEDHLDFRGLPELNDDGLFHYIKNLRGINMLDLNETEITNNAIEMISKLEYVTELRIKGCENIDDKCIADLNNIKSLKFLHLKDTSITIDGILQLKDLTDLTTLLFSVDDTAVIEDKMLLLQEMLPNCNFVVNSVPYTFY